jgi:hypothetical protein
LAFLALTAGGLSGLLSVGPDDEGAEGTCGVERWSVKTGTDADVGAIDLANPVPTTVAALRSLAKPALLPANTRIRPTETTVYSITAMLSVYKREDDADYHIVIVDSAGNTMITEIPDPACVGPGSPLAAGIQNARAEFDARLNPTTTFKTANMQATVTGVGFFDFLHGQTGVAPNGIELHPLLDITFATAPTATPSPTPTPAPVPGQCVSTIGPGIPPPATVPSGVEGFHAAWFGQSGYQSLCPGAQATAIVAFYNSGSLGWVSGVLGQVAYLGTWEPVPGQDQPSVLGGDGQQGSPHTGWPRYNRVAIQPASYVGPGQVAWFQFTVQAPVVPGSYTLAIRPLIEGAQWMEDYGVFWVVTVLKPDGSAPLATPTPTVPPASAGLFVTITNSRWGAITARTLAGATCTVRVRFPSGSISSAAGVQNSATAGSDGLVSWTYNTTSNTTPGTGTNTVTCALQGQSASDSAPFSVP